MPNASRVVVVVSAALLAACAGRHHPAPSTAAGPPPPVGSNRFWGAGVDGRFDVDSAGLVRLVANGVSCQAMRPQMVDDELRMYCSTVQLRVPLGANGFAESGRAVLVTPGQRRTTSDPFACSDRRGAWLASEAAATCTPTPRQEGAGTGSQYTSTTVRVARSD